VRREAASDSLRGIQVISGQSRQAIVSFSACAIARQWPAKKISKLPNLTLLRGRAFFSHASTDSMSVAMRITYGRREHLRHSALPPLNTQSQVFQAGTGFVDHAELAAAFSNAGGLRCPVPAPAAAKELKE
jgi:hypothetical protein